MKIPAAFDIPEASDAAFPRKEGFPPRATKGPHSANPAGGFTLVEALVVAVIMGILASVAIPVYTGYVKNQRKQVVRALSQTGAVGASAYKRRTGLSPTANAGQINLFISDPSRYTMTITPTQIIISDQLSSSDIISDTTNY